MKKVLLGLLAISAISMSAPITNETMNAEVVDKSSVVQQGQTGVVKINGSMISTIPVVKYVIYAGDAEGKTKSDTLVLPDFVLAPEGRITDGGFSPTAVMQSIYVKKITTSGTGTEAPTFGEFAEGEKVKFKVKLDPFYTAIPRINDFIEVGSKELYLDPAALMAKKDVNIPHTRGTIYVGARGLLMGTEFGDGTLSFARGISISSKIKGELKFETTDREGALGRFDYIINLNQAGVAEYSETILNYFKTKKPFTAVQVEAIVQ